MKRQMTEWEGALGNRASDKKQRQNRGDMHTPAAGGTAPVVAWISQETLADFPPHVQKQALSLGRQKKPWHVETEITNLVTSLWFQKSTSALCLLSARLPSVKY